MSGWRRVTRLLLSSVEVCLIFSSVALWEYDSVCKCVRALNTRKNTLHQGDARDIQELWQDTLANQCLWNQIPGLGPFSILLPWTTEVTLEALLVLRWDWSPSPILYLLFYHEVHPRGDLQTWTGTPGASVEPVLPLLLYFMFLSPMAQPGRRVAGKHFQKHPHGCARRCVSMVILN
ncbi:hypothetical protein H671_2g4673 [Cricetulus griseus]|nr:hypothetical protein H671_2g4673 [Cricetulus griseus]